MSRSGTLNCLGLLWLLGSSCGSGERKKLEDLAPPRYRWVHRVSLCDLNRVVDGGGVLWESRGCESELLFESLGQVRSVTAVISAFAQLPCDGQAKTVADCAGSRHSFESVAADGSERICAVCGSGAIPGAIDGLAEPYLQVVRALVE